MVNCGNGDVCFACVRIWVIVWGYFSCSCKNAFTHPSTDNFIELKRCFHVNNIDVHKNGNITGWFRKKTLHPTICVHFFHCHIVLLIEYSLLFNVAVIFRVFDGKFLWIWTDARGKHQPPNNIIVVVIMTFNSFKGVCVVTSFIYWIFERLNQISFCAGTRT